MQNSTYHGQGAQTQSRVAREPIPLGKRAAFSPAEFGNPLLTKEQAASYIGCSRRYIERAVTARRLKALRPTGGLWRVRRSDLDAFTSNKMLHELAREVRGVEIKRGKRLTVTQYKTIFSNWEAASRSFLRKGHDYFTEFLAKLSIVTMPKGETLESAFQRSESRRPPSKVSLVPNKGLRSLASLCRELQECSATSLSCCAKRALRSCSKYHSKRSRSGFVH